MGSLQQTLVFIGVFVAIALAYYKLYLGAMARFCDRHGYTYAWADPDAEASTRVLIEGGTLSGFIAGAARGHSFIFCTRSWDRPAGNASSSTTAHSSNVLIPLRNPLPSFAIRFIGTLPRGWTLDSQTISIPDADDFTASYHVSGAEEDAVRRTVTPHLCRALTASNPVHLLCDGRSILCTWSGRVGWPAQIQRFLEGAVTIAEVLDTARASSVDAGPVFSASGTPAPRRVPPSPVRRIRFGSFAAGAALSVFGGILLALGGVFAVTGYVAGTLDPGATRGLVVFFAVSLAGAIIGLGMSRLAARAWREQPIFGFRKSRRAADPVERAARRWANLLVAREKSESNRAAIGAVDPAAAEVVRTVLGDRTGNATIDGMLNGAIVTDIGQLCRALVELETGMAPEDSANHARLTRLVDEALAAARSGRR